MEPDYTVSDLTIFHTHRQERIIKRLNRLVGLGPALFYKDACRLMAQNSDFTSTSHLVSHLLRDIESALRDVLEPFIDRALIKDDESEETHRVEIISILNALEISLSDPIAKAWLGVIGKENIKALHARAHRNNLEPPRPVNREFTDFWFDMEAIFDVILDRLESNYITILDKLDELRRKKIPSKKNVNFIKKHIPHNIVAFNYFFQGLDNHAWLKPLWKGGFFLNPPEPIENKDEGTISYPQWPQSRYLVSMASLEPELVSDIILEIETTNGYIQSDLVDAVCQILPSLAAKHVEKVSRWVKNPTFLLGSKIGNLISYLAKAKEIEAATLLTSEFLRLRPEKRLYGGKETEEALPIHLEPLSQISSWEYGEFLKHGYLDFMKVAPMEALTSVINILDDAIRLFVDNQTEEFQDYSYVWRPAIKDDQQNQGQEEPRGLLVTAVRDTAEYCVKQYPLKIEKILLVLEEKKWIVFKRIAIHLTSLFGTENIQLVENCILNRDLFNKSFVYHEYVILIQDHYKNLSIEKQKKFLRWIREDPIYPVGEENPTEYKEWWQLRWLTVLKGQLPNPWEKKRQFLVKKYSEPEHPDFSFWSSEVMSGPSSPISPEQFKTMNLDEVISLLQRWKAPKGFTMDSPEGISRSLSTAISQDPIRFANEIEKFVGCDPTYFHGVFTGLLQALKEEKNFDWHPVIEVMIWVVNQGKEIPGRQAKESWDIDPDWGWTRTEIARLLESGFNSIKNQIPYKLNKSVWQVLLPLTDDPNPTVEEEAHNSMDPATFSLNTTRGTAFHALVAYALWKKRNILKRRKNKKGETSLCRNMAEVLEVLEKHLIRNYDPSLSIHAVYGWRFPNLAYIDRKWAEANKARIFPMNMENRQYWNAAWNACIGFNQPNTSLFQDLFAEYQYSISSLETITMKSVWGNNPIERLVEHLILYYAWNELDLRSEMMNAFWNQSTPGLRSHAINFIGKVDKNTPPEIITRFKLLWENRLLVVSKADDKKPYIEELQAFGWLFVSGVYDDEWCLDQLDKVLPITGEIDYDHGVVERLGLLSDKYPLRVVQLMGSLFEGEKKGWGMALWKDDTEIILSKALSSNDLDANQAAVDLINRLASRGYTDYKTLLSS